MKTIGMIRGMSWESTKFYYEILNKEVKGRLGGLHSAKVVLYSFDFEIIKKFQFEGRWEEATKLLCEAAQTLEQAGADLVILCTNTMHISATNIAESIRIPFFTYRRCNSIPTTKRRQEKYRLTRHKVYNGRRFL
ncbi:Asp/Glu/Hydantoin racemase [Bacillus sp. UNCCL13]|nr:Asp/Glu/Hydantoin racemase [Bacillus sp. UNCCL13]